MIQKISIMVFLDAMLIKLIPSVRVTQESLGFGIQPRFINILSLIAARQMRLEHLQTKYVTIPYMLFTIQFYVVFYKGILTLTFLFENGIAQLYTDVLIPRVTRLGVAQSVPFCV